MGRWLTLLSGLLVWAAHFLGVYALASVATLRGPQDDPPLLAAHLAFSLLCAGAAAALAVRFGLLSLVGEEPQRFVHKLAALGSGLAVVAIAWQTLPAVIR